MSGKNKAPNILFIFTDQQSRRAMSAYGNPYVHTPGMDSIAATGVMFGNSYCVSPVCGPSRTTLATGVMPHEAGVDTNSIPLPPDIPTVGQIFRKVGYETAWAGKWHIAVSFPQDPETIPGFDVLPLIPRNPGIDYSTTEAAIEFLKKPHEKPFFLSVSLNNPHDICGWTTQPHHPHSCPDGLPPLPANFAVDPDEPEFIQLCRERKHYGGEGQYTRTWGVPDWRAYLNAYYSFVEQADRCVERIIGALRESGLEENTLVVFTADHGEGMAAHHWVVKLMLYEEPVTVPLALSWKGVIPSGVMDWDHLVSGLDIVPTLCDYAGITPPPGLRGMSLREIIEKPTLPGHAFVVSELQPDPKRPELKGRMLRTRRFKYVAFSYGRNPEMLFDLQQDPGETCNLAHDPAHHGELTRHRALLQTWIAETNDSFTCPCQ